MAEEKSAKAAKLEQQARSKAEREAQVKAQRERFKRRERNKRIFNYSFIALLVIVLGIILYTVLQPSGPAIQDKLAQCITQSGAVMYGTEWCTHCQEQKRLFGDSFRYIDFVNCDLKPDICSAEGVEVFPTWVFADGRNASSAQSLDVLAARTGCQ
jgi:hypothetical protein